MGEGEIDRFAQGFRIVLKAGRRIVVGRRCDAGSFHQRPEVNRIEPDDGKPLPRAQVFAQDNGGQVAAGRDGGNGEADGRGHAGNDPGVEQAEQGLIVQRRQPGLPAQARQMVGIGGNDIAEGSSRRAARQPGRGPGSIQIREVHAEQADFRRGGHHIANRKVISTTLLL